ncbi:hypothetical protein [Bradyrhizobium sp. dw_411]|uniref:hypothetical protein n=1 Tax=Bradyrhizobium sp. dw_411 TaxID=2720082 RepID=UPI001BCD76F3|nr:hypothetical protein [Bradyrhizobium sp. dw_411]
MKLVQINKLNNHSVSHSLRTLKAAKSQLSLPVDEDSTPSALMAQIRLCDVLLGEIRTIGACLANGLYRQDMIRRRLIVTSRPRAVQHSKLSPHNERRNRLRARV